MWDEGRVIGVVTLEVADGLISEIRTVMNPHKLTLWKHSHHGRDAADSLTIHVRQRSYA